MNLYLVKFKTPSGNCSDVIWAKSELDCAFFITDLSDEYEVTSIDNIGLEPEDKTGYAKLI